jgi:hypothetical protein
MASENTRERDLYSRVASYLRTAVGCSDTAIDTGLQLGRIDVIGVRGIGGDLSGEAETSAVEVKAGRQPFATSAGQADGYSVYAHRCYLVDLRIGRQPFNGNEIDIASRLGIGLLALRPKGVREVLSAPRNEPIERLNLELLERLGYARCTIFCATFDGPGRAISCARALHDALDRIGIAVRIGMHTGEVEVRGERIGGLAVHIGARGGSHRRRRRHRRVEHGEGPRGGLGTRVRRPR